MSVHTIIMTQGNFLHRDSLNFPFEERGLQFGDGVYEVIRIYQGEYYLLTDHVNRLYRSLAVIDLSINQSKKELIALLNELLIKNKITNDAHVYLQVTRGSVARNPVYPEVNLPNIFAYVKDTPRPINQLNNGVTAITYPDERWNNCYIKSLNLLPNILAKQKAKEHDAYEAILHKDGDVTDCSFSNIFLIKDNMIFTHPANESILHGCIRNKVKNFSKNLEIPFHETIFTLTDIKSADELFLTSSINEILPIIEVDNNLISTGKPGELTKKLQIAYQIDAKIYK